MIQRGPRARSIHNDRKSVKQRRFAAAPTIDRLLRVADVEEGALAAGVHNDLFDEGAKHGPLGAAGVLKLVEQPVVEALVDAVGDLIAPSNRLVHLSSSARSANELVISGVDGARRARFALSTPRSFR